MAPFEVLGHPAREAVRSPGDALVDRADVVMNRGVPAAGGGTLRRTDATFVVAQVEPPRTLVHSSERGPTRVTWSLTLTGEGAPAPACTRVHLRLRLGPVRRTWLARSAAGALDLVTVAGLAAGLRERIAEQDRHGPG